MRKGGDRCRLFVFPIRICPGRLARSLACLLCFSFPCFLRSLLSDWHTPAITESGRTPMTNQESKQKKEVLVE